MRVTLQAFSSSGGSYDVEFSDKDGHIRVYCHCKAGLLQQMCKHKLALMKGDVKMLYDASQAPLLQQVLESPAYPALKVLIEKYEADMSEIEREMAQVKAKEAMIKNDFVYELTHGKPNLNAKVKIQSRTITRVTVQGS